LVDTIDIESCGAVVTSIGFKTGAWGNQQFAELNRMGNSIGLSPEEAQFGPETVTLPLHTG
jgi:hypothetical protein